MGKDMINKKQNIVFFYNIISIWALCFMFFENENTKSHQGYDHYIFFNEKKSHLRDGHKNSALFSLLKKSKTHKIKARQIIARQSELVVNHYIVKEGVIRLVKHLSDGRRQVLEFSLPGDLIGQHFREHWPFDIEAVTAVTTYQIPKKSMDTIITEHPKISLSLYKTTAHELDLYHEHIIRLTSTTAEEKICRFLLDLRTRWHAIKAEDPMFIPMPMTRQDVADYLGLTFETVSRILNRLQKKAIIEIFSNGIEITNVGFFEKYQIENPH